jgi:hypothetical protein
MTRPRLSRAERQRLEKQRRAQDAERQMTMIEMSLAAIESLTRTALMATVAYSKGKMPKVRYDAMMVRLTRELDMLRSAREVRAEPAYDPPAMKS